MIELIILIVSVVFIALKTWLVESRHDYCMSMDSKGSPFRKGWHFWGQVNEALWVTAIAGLSAVFIGWIALLLIPILWLVYWLVHDMAMGYRLTGDVWYLGKTSWVDQKASEIFQGSGALYAFFKIFWLFLLIGTFFSLRKK
jgi:hypothetical protein